MNQLSFLTDHDRMVVADRFSASLNTITLMDETRFHHGDMIILSVITVMNAITAMIVVAVMSFMNAINAMKVGSRIILTFNLDN